MTMGEKITSLRKRAGYSQETLADRLDVSRQSVSKWELDVSVPDLNRIVQMSELFDVPTDYLLKEDEVYMPKEERMRRMSDEEVELFLDLKRRERKRLPVAVGLCILGAAVLIGMGALSIVYRDGEDQLGALGLIVLLILVAIGVGIMVSDSMKLARFEWIEKEPVMISSKMLKHIRMLKEENAQSHIRNTTIGVCLCILAVIPLFMTLFMTLLLTKENELAMVLSVVLLLLIVMCGVYLFIRDGVWEGALDSLLQEGEYSVDEKSFKKKYSFFPGLYWCTATAIYLAWSFTSEQWDRTWLVFAVAGVLYGGLEALLRAGKRR